MKNIITTILMSVLLCGCGATVTNYTRHKFIIKSSTALSQADDSIEKIILNNNYHKQKQGYDGLMVFEHNEYDHQKFYVLTSTNILVDAVLFKPGLYQSHDPRKAIGEILEYAKNSDSKIITIRKMTSEESGVKPKNVHNQWLDFTVKTPVD